MAPLQVTNFEKDVVYLFQFAGYDTVSSSSPYCIKVEAFLRANDLKFERRNTNVRGANGLLPFIELNGVQTCDSEAIFKRLTDHFHIQNYADAHEEGVGYALERMIENHALHLLRYDMCRRAREFIRLMAGGRVPGFLMGIVSALGGWYMRRLMRGMVRKTIGSFTDAEYDEMLKTDLLQLQNVLGDKQFLMSETPSRVDCIAFAHIGYSYYIMPHARTRIHELIDSKNLSGFKEYLERTKKTLFGDEFKNKK